VTEKVFPEEQNVASIELPFYGGEGYEDANDLQEAWLD
jgi:hypothetical protein